MKTASALANTHKQTRLKLPQKNLQRDWKNEFSSRKNTKILLLVECLFKWRILISNDDYEREKFQFGQTGWMGVLLVGY